MPTFFLDPGWPGKKIEIKMALQRRQAIDLRSSHLGQTGTLQAQKSYQVSPTMLIFPQTLPIFLHGSRVMPNVNREQWVNVVTSSATIVSLDGSWSCPGKGSRINHSPHCPDGRQTTFEEAFSKTSFLLNENRDLHANVPYRSGLHPSWHFTRFWHSANVEESRYAFAQLRWIWCCPVSRRNFAEFAFHFRIVFPK